MKQGSFRTVRHLVILLIMLSMTVFPAFGDPNTVDQVSIILDKFSGELAKEWTISGRTFNYEYEWALDASKFATTISNESYPRLTYVDAWPQALYGTNRNNLDIRSLGIWGKFDRRGYNWIDVYPVIPGSGSESEPPAPFEIPIPGRVQSIDMWVWGSNFNYYIEAYFRDYQGVVHSVPLGNMGYTGWRNLRARIPNHIPQSRRTQPNFAGLQFIKFRIWTTPLERVDNFYIYFNQMKILTDIHETLFDGNDLIDPDKVREIWAAN